MDRFCTEGWEFDAKHGNLCLAASSSRARSGFLPRRRVNSVADVEGLDPCREAFACSHAALATGFPRACKASICSTLQATVAFSATCVHLHFRRAVVFGIKKRGGGFVPKRRMRGPIYKLSMEEAPSGAALLGDEPPIPNLHHYSRTC